MLNFLNAEFFNYHAHGASIAVHFNQLPVLEGPRL